MSFPLIVAITTRDRPELLARTLGFLAKCKVPDGFLKVVVVENGGRRDAESIVANSGAPFPISYHTIPQPGKNRALNEVIKAYPEAFVIFFDDDVRVDGNVLLEYAKAVARTGTGVFFGGRCLVDYDEPPPAWIIRYLPWSAKGWSMGASPCEIRKALGFNWGAFAKDILADGGFLDFLGPGTMHSIGDESEMQARLIRSGRKGEYLPEALVWHFVPKERCSDRWVIQRNYQHGMAHGIKMRFLPKDEKQRLVRVFRRRARTMSAVRWVIPLLGRRLSFHFRKSCCWNYGISAGLEMNVDRFDRSISVAPDQCLERSSSLK